MPACCPAPHMNRLQAGYFDNVKVNERDTYDNPTITVYDPATGYFSPDSRDMADQLEAAW